MYISISSLQSDGTVPPPSMIVVPLALYSSTKQVFETPEIVLVDKLLPRGYQYLHCEEIHLGKCAYIK